MSLSPISKTYSPQFWLLCLSSFFFFASFNMILPELPALLEKLGGAEYKGLIISLFTVTALLSRPFSGKLADKIGRIPVMIFGSAVCLVCSLIYPFLTSVYGFLLLRFLHGFSTGFTPTGLTAYISDVIPAERRGEAMGLVTTFGTLGMAAGPGLGGWIATDFGLDFMFYGSALFGLFSVVVFTGVKETLPDKQKFHHDHLKLEVGDLFEPRVMVPCIIMALTAYSFGAMLTLIPDLSEDLGFENKGIMFMVFTLASILVRIAAGSLSDKYGRPIVMMFSTSLIAISMVMIGLAESKAMLWAGGIVYGLANGMNSPTLFAWVTDLSHENFKGRGFSSLYISMEFGIGVGALITGFIYGNHVGNFFHAFLSCGILSAAAFLYLIVKTYNAKRPVPD